MDKERVWKTILVLLFWWVIIIVVLVKGIFSWGSKEDKNDKHNNR